MENIEPFIWVVSQLVFIVFICVGFGGFASRIRKGCFWYGFLFGPFGLFVAHALNVSDLLKNSNSMNSRLADINSKVNHILAQTFE